MVCGSVLITNNSRTIMDLHRKFVKLGREKNRIQYKLLGLLPEISVSGVYQKYCKTIEGYAWKFAQIPSSVVRKTLRLEKYLENKPCLKAAVAEVGVHKVAMVASIATAETDAAFADKVKNMSKPAVQEWAKELRGGMEGDDLKIGANLGASKPCCAVPTTIKLELDPEMTFLFLQVKKKYKGNNIEVMKRILREAVVREGLGVEMGAVGREDGVGSNVEDIITGYVNDKCEFLADDSDNSVDGNLSPGTTFCEVRQSPSGLNFVRYIRKAIRSKALKESCNQCAYPGCNRPPDLMHHPNRFSKTKNHKNVKPMCKQHHEFAHNGLIENEAKEPEKWRLRIDGQLNPTDQLYREYRREALR